VLPDHPPTAPSGWVFATPPPLFGPAPVVVPPGVDTAISNIVWTYTGAPITTPGLVGIFTVTIDQALARLPEINYVTICGSGNETEIVLGSTAPTVVVPEPSSAVYLSIAGATLGLGLWRRRRVG
jgi:hypothetical protein